MAVTVNAKLPDWVGVPDSVAVAALKLMPVGSVPARPKVTGAVPPVCVNTCEYALPTVAAGTVAGLTVMAGQLMTLMRPIAGRSLAVRVGDGDVLQAGGRAHRGDVQRDLRRRVEVTELTVTAPLTADAMRFGEAGAARVGAGVEELGAARRGPGDRRR